MNGFEVQKRVLEKVPQMGAAFVFMTDRVTDEDRQFFRSNFENPLLEKSPSCADLRRVIGPRDLGTTGRSPAAARA
jgi:hypothetical protein